MFSFLFATHFFFSFKIIGKDYPESGINRSGFLSLLYYNKGVVAGRNNSRLNNGQSDYETITIVKQDNSLSNIFKAILQSLILPWRAYEFPSQEELKQKQNYWQAEKILKLHLHILSPPLIGKKTGRIAGLLHSITYRLSLSPVGNSRLYSSWSIQSSTVTQPRRQLVGYLDGKISSGSKISHLHYFDN